MRILSSLILLCALSATAASAQAPIPAAPAATTTAPATKAEAKEKKAVVVQEKAYLKKCGLDLPRDCSLLPEVQAHANDVAGAKAAIASCNALDSSMTSFCGLVIIYEPDSPEIITAVKQVIAAKKDLMAKLAALGAKKP